MKTIFKKLLIGCVLIPSLVQSNVSFKKDSTKSKECLFVTGVAVDENDIPIDSVTIRLFKENDEACKIKLIQSKKHPDNNFEFMLKKNKSYTIEVSKPGYVTRSVQFFTDLPSNVSTKSLFEFDFNVTLFKEKKMDDDYLDFPIAIISYNKQTKTFENNADYTTFIQTKINESEEFEIAKNEIKPKNIAPK